MNNFLFKIFAQKSNAERSYEDSTFGYCVIRCALFPLFIFYEVSAGRGERRIRVIVSCDESLFTSHGGGCAE